VAHWNHLKALEAIREKGLVKTTLCYLEKNGAYLMLYRNKKKNDLNEGKWIGVGGHVEKGESIVACLKREIKEETGLTLTHYVYRGYIDFLNDLYDPERMYLYTGDQFTGEEIVCDEGTLSWIPKEKIMELNLWEGDRVFLPLLNQKKSQPFQLTLVYQKNKLSEVRGPYYPKR
jgi:8-oxo-dGTP diphosphatase